MMQPLDQHRYQVRFEWGSEGLARLAPADIVVVVDVLECSTAVTDAVAAGAQVGLDDPRLEAAAAVLEAARGDGVVMLGCLRNASAVAEAVLETQRERGARTSVAVIAAGDVDGAGASRTAVEDLLGAGAVIHALGERGTDHTSPEAAVAGESFRGLRGAVRHLLTASGSGQALIGADRRDTVVRAAEVDAVPVVPVLRGSVFAAR